MVQKKLVSSSPPPPPPREDEAYHGGKVGGKVCAKAPKDHTYVHQERRDEERRIEKPLMEQLHPP
jgi:hypothetical protein